MESSTDYLLTLQEAASLIDLSTRKLSDYYRVGEVRHIMRRKHGEGQKRVFISVSSLIQFANDKDDFYINRKFLAGLSQEIQEIVKAESTEDGIDQQQFQESTNNSSPKKHTQEPSASTNRIADSEMIEYLKTQIEKVEGERDLYRDRLESKNKELLDRADKASVTLQTVAQLVEKTATLHTIANRDIQRLRDGSLKPELLSLQPIPELKADGTVEWDVIDESFSKHPHQSTIYEASITAEPESTPTASPDISEAIVINSQTALPTPPAEPQPSPPPVSENENTEPPKSTASNSGRKRNPKPQNSKPKKKRKAIKKKSNSKKSASSHPKQKNQPAPKKKGFWSKLNPFN